MKTIKNLIVFEGIDGSGTTTQLKNLPALFGGLGLAFHQTAEPTDNSEGRLIRRILKGELEADPGTVAYLFAANRHEHLYGKGGILDHIASGEIVVCDRYVLSSLAYQGMTCGLELPERLNSDFPAPGLTIFFEIDAETAMARVNSRSTLEIYERLHFQKEVAAAYGRVIESALAKGWKVERIDASKPLEQVGEQVKQAIRGHLSLE